jgi:hypothetical protein
MIGARSFYKYGLNTIRFLFFIETATTALLLTVVGPTAVVADLTQVADPMEVEDPTEGGQAVMAAVVASTLRTEPHHPVVVSVVPT